MAHSHHGYRTDPPADCCAPLRQRGGWALPLVMLIACGVAAAGCQSSRKTANSDIGAIRNPFALAGTADGPIEGSLDPMKGLPEYEQAMAIYREGKIEEAEKAFKKVAKQFKDHPVEEDALFMIAECQYRRKRYSWAQDSYDKLLKKYPTSRYLEESTQRLFSIASIWLNPNGKTPPEELVRVSAADVDGTNENGIEVPYSLPIVPNLFDRTRPVFDTQGRALQALKSVWLHDPTGPLADDAVMMTAAYHLRRGDHREANVYFKILREEYPKSEHAKHAFVLGTGVLLATYQGAKYDATALDEADNLVRSTLNIYPESEHREKLQQDLQRIRMEDAARDWARIEFYQRKYNHQAVALYCEMLIERFPDSEYADRARALLAEIDPQYRPVSLGVAEIARTPPDRSDGSSEPGRISLSDDP